MSEELNKKDEEDSEYIKYKKMMSTVFYEIKNLEQKMRDMQVAFDDAQRSHASGVQNVYDKFIEIEKRQIDIEDLLKSDRITDLVKKIPTESDIRGMLLKVENTDVSRLTKSIDEMRDNLQEMIDRFTW